MTDTGNSLMFFFVVFFSCRTDRTRWLEAIKHPQNEKAKEDEKIYERWGEYSGQESGWGMRGGGRGEEQCGMHRFSYCCV